MDDSSVGPAQTGWHSYRCPVCGHTDEVALDGEEPGLVPCSHCGTELELSVRSADEVPVTVRVASRWRKGR